MHQPYYKDDLQNTFLLPWVRLRCAKDYYKMPALLDGYPSIKQTFNLVPALVAQVEDYVEGRSADVYLDLARRPVSELTTDERAFIARWMTESSQIRRVRQYPRYLDLVRKREQAWPRAADEMAKLFSDAELRDLQVWFNLSWIGPEVMAADDRIAELVRKGRDFSEDDKLPVFDLQVDLQRKVLPKYREVQDRGQAELITSPYYHPILPLIAELGIARVARPDLAMPRRLFSHPEDAAEQLRLGIEAHTRRFSTRPRGVWPPEAAVSDDVARLAADQGLEWMLSDEGILARSSGSPINRDGDGQLMQPELLYAPYRMETSGGPIRLVFRDGRLSNAIGFEYQNSTADEAAKDLIDRLHGIRRRQQDAPLLTVIALDGENCWDFYEANGNDFLHSLYSRLSHDPEVKTVTVSEFLAEFPTQRSLARIHPGSWINANFDTWVGDQEHNVAWELLAEARDFLSERERQADAPAELAGACREALIAEGSDWFWWFGRSHDSGMDQIWDSLFRLHLRNIYMSCQQPPPASLYQSIVKDAESSASKRPDRKITPKLNGAVDHEEWNAAGYVDVTALFGAMHPPKGAIRRIWFGHDDRNLYLRFDLLGGGRPPRAVELEMLFSARPGRRPDGEGDAGGWPKRTGRGDFGFDPAFRLTGRGVAQSLEGDGPRRSGGDAALRQHRRGKVWPPRSADQPGGAAGASAGQRRCARGADRREHSDLFHRKSAILRSRGDVWILGR